jgi:hypothetical protein
MTIGLDDITYLPAIRSRSAELRGYRELRAETRAGLMPVVSLGQMGNSKDPVRLLENLHTHLDPFFLDLNTTPNQQCEGWEKLCDPANAFQAWRDFAKRSEKAVPVALIGEGGKLREFVQQVRAIEREYGKVVVRSRKPTHDAGLLQTVVSSVDSVANLLIVLDFGYIRGSMEPREIEARRIISGLRLIDDTVRIAVVASSFPRSVIAFGENQGALDIQERSFHLNIGGDDVAIYGDHASIYPEPFEPIQSRFVPRIDYATSTHWRYRRYRQDDFGYLRCAEELVNMPDWEPSFANEVWGAARIAETVSRRSPPDGFNAPSNWIAARVNMHIERQRGWSLAIREEDGWDDGDGDV